MGVRLDWAVDEQRLVSNLMAVVKSLLDVDWKVFVAVKDRQAI